ncbi:MAG: alkaline phosphatase family protein, partial [Bdellovibrionota bacterium]
MKTVFALILVSSLVMLQTACQSTSIVSDDFNDAVDEGDFKTADRTSIIFLVDGLSKTALDQAYQSGKISRISGYFPMPKGNFRLARATFPSLTFPNITSILTGESISTHPITGNKIVVGDDEVDFENVTSWPVLGRLVKERSIFYRLGENKESSVSFSYSFPRGATVHLEKNVDAGVYYTEGNYAAIDSNVIANLEGLLEQKSWPRFIFVHLIGVDALSHKHGPED